MSLAGGRKTGLNFVYSSSKPFTFITKIIESMFLIKENQVIMLIDEQLAKDYLVKNNQRKLKNSVISVFMKASGLKGWSTKPMSQNRWIHYSDEVIARMFERRLTSFCEKYYLITDKDQISRVIYFFELSFVRTLAKKYQTSSKKIFSSKITRKRAYLLLYNEKTNTYSTHFCKKKVYSIFVIKN